MSGHLKPYKSYIFRDKDPVIDMMRTAVEDSGNSYVHISVDSGVAAGTLTNWFKGDTKRPQFATLQAVAYALGKEFVLQNKQGKRQVTRVKSRFRRVDGKS
jgi:hypothetical protein